MGAANIQAKVRRGLSRAINKTGSTSSDLVYLVNKTISGGDSPINPPVTSTNDVLLVDAIFKSYDQKLIGANIQAGDRQLVSNSDVAISVGDTIKEGVNLYVVINIDIKAPTSDVLAYIAQVRLK